MTDQPVLPDQTQAPGAEPVAGVPLRRRKKARRPPARWPWLLVGILIGALGLAAFQSYTRLGLPLWVYDELNAPETVGAPADSNAAAGTVDPSKLSVRDANARGSSSAKVTVFEYSDFQCPFCRKYAVETDPQIVTGYVDKGQVRIVYKHLAILGQESLYAAQAAECAADLGQFWPYHDLLFQKQTSAHNTGVFSKDNLVQYAKDLGLDMARFEPCLRNDATLARVQADTQEAEALGFQGTPSFIVAGQRIIGAQPFATFAQAIDKGLQD